MKQTIKLNENDWHRLIKESVNNILKEEQTNIQDYAHNVVSIMIGTSMPQWISY